MILDSVLNQDIDHHNEFSPRSYDIMLAALRRVIRDAKSTEVFQKFLGSKVYRTVDEKIRITRRAVQGHLDNLEASVSSYQRRFHTAKLKAATFELKHYEYCRHKLDDASQEFEDEQSAIIQLLDVDRSHDALTVRKCWERYIEFLGKLPTITEKAMREVAEEAKFQQEVGRCEEAVESRVGETIEADTLHFDIGKHLQLPT